MQKKYFIQYKDFISTISTLSSPPSNSFNSSSMILSFFINSTKLNGVLHPSLGSLGQFWLTKINFSSKFLDCRRHLLRLAQIPAREKMCSVSICELTIPRICLARKVTTGKIDSCFSHHWKGFFISFTST